MWCGYPTFNQYPQFKNNRRWYRGWKSFKTIGFMIGRITLTINKGCLTCMVLCHTGGTRTKFTTTIKTPATDNNVCNGLLHSRCSEAASFAEKINSGSYSQRCCFQNNFLQLLELGMETVGASWKQNGQCFTNKRFVGRKKVAGPKRKFRLLKWFLSWKQRSDRISRVLLHSKTNR